MTAATQLIKSYESTTEAESGREVHHCLDCPRPARNEGRCGFHDRAAIRREEIEWLRSFGWTNEKIAARFGLRPVSIERYAYPRGAHR